MAFNTCSFCNYTVQRKRFLNGKMVYKQVDGGTSLRRQLFRCSITYESFVDGTEQTRYRVEREYTLIRAACGCPITIHPDYPSTLIFYKEIRQSDFICSGFVLIKCQECEGISNYESKS